MAVTSPRNKLKCRSDFTRDTSSYNTGWIGTSYSGPGFDGRNQRLFSRERRSVVIDSASCADVSINFARESTRRRDFSLKSSQSSGIDRS